VEKRALSLSFFLFFLAELEDESGIVKVEDKPASPSLFFPLFSPGWHGDPQARRLDDAFLLLFFFGAGHGSNRTSQPCGVPDLRRRVLASSSFSLFH